MTRRNLCQSSGTMFRLQGVTRGEEYRRLMTCKITSFQSIRSTRKGADVAKSIKGRNLPRLMTDLRDHHTFSKDEACYSPLQLRIDHSCQRREVCSEILQLSTCDRMPGRTQQWPWLHHHPAGTGVGGQAVGNLKDVFKRWPMRRLGVWRRGLHQVHCE